MCCLQIEDAPYLQEAAKDLHECMRGSCCGKGKLLPQPLILSNTSMNTCSCIITASSNGTMDNYYGRHYVIHESHSKCNAAGGSL